MTGHRSQIHSIGKTGRYLEMTDVFGYHGVQHWPVNAFHTRRRRSGKSQFAQELARKLGKNVLFVATGQALDEEMQSRISQHKKTRPKAGEPWRISNIGKQIVTRIADAQCDIDCLTLLSQSAGRQPDYPKAENKSYPNKAAHSLHDS